MNKDFKTSLLTNFLISLGTLYTSNIDTNMNLNKNSFVCVKGHKYAIDQENIFFQKRQSLIKNNLEKMLSIKLKDEQVPTIAICCSGGGFRSMLSTTGFLCGAQSIGLLDSTMYIATISGSSWALIPWILQGNSIKTFKNELILKCDNFYKLKKISNLSVNNLKIIKDFIIDTYRTFLKVKKIKNKYKQNISFIDWYGIMLSNFLLKEFQENRFDLKLSDLAEKTSSANTPFPIFAAASQFDHYQYHWLEFTPFYVGSLYLNSYIPVKAFGQKFYNGKTIDDAPEQSLEYLMGIFGSAFSASLRDALEKFTTLKIPKEIAKIVQKAENKIDQFGWANKKISYASVANFTFGMQNSPIKNKTNLAIVDGGYLCNLPLIPLLEKNRKVDIVFVLDNSNQKHARPNNLKKSEILAQEKNYKFPPIDYKKALTQNFSVFKDENDPDCPIIVYIPLLKDPTYSKWFNPQKAKFCGTTNFFYSQSQAEMLSGLTKHIIKNHKNEIWEVIKDRLSGNLKHPTKNQKPVLEKYYSNQSL